MDFSSFFWRMIWLAVNQMPCNWMRIFDSIEANAYKYHYQNMLNMEIITGANVNLHPRPQNRLIWFAFVWDVVHSENGSQSNGFELCCWSFEVGWIHWKPIWWYANQFVVNIYIYDAREIGNLLYRGTELCKQKLI